MEKMKNVNEGKNLKVAVETPSSIWQHVQGNPSKFESKNLKDYYGTMAETYLSVNGYTPPKDDKKMEDFLHREPQWEDTIKVMRAKANEPSVNMVRHFVVMDFLIRKFRPVGWGSPGELVSL